MQLKYPAFPGRLTSYQSSVRGHLSLRPTSAQVAEQFCSVEQIIYREHCYHALPSYASVLADLAASPHNLVAQDRIIQFPFIPTTANEQTEEDLERQKRKREEATQRLRETAAKQRQEKVRPLHISFAPLADRFVSCSLSDSRRR